MHMEGCYSKFLQMKGITKRFPGVLANDHVNFEMEKGEIHGLLGENGAGKTTLMRILFGLYHADEGEIWFKGKRIDAKSPLEAIKLGMGMVHQHFMLIPKFTVTESVILGLKSTRRSGLGRGILLDIEGAQKRIVQISEKYGLEVDPKAKISELSVGERQRVEIIKNLYRGVELLILDEPTAVLTPQEVKSLFHIFTGMAKEGQISIIFITHKLDEVMEVSQRVTVLRNGKFVKTLKTKDTDTKRLAKMMIGREVLFRIEKELMVPGKEILKVENLHIIGDNGLPAVNNVSFSVKEREILGIAGVEGNGQNELVEAITHLRESNGGKIYLEGQEIAEKSVRDILDLGICHIPAERITTGSLQDMSVAENLIMENYSKPPFCNGPIGILNPPAIDSFAEKLISEFDVRTPNKDVLVKTLSGGNLQKLILARELSREPRLIVACNPARGLDVAATEYVRNKILEQRKAGSAILLISADLDEILFMSDRIAVMYNGRIVGIVSHKEATKEKIGLLMLGVKE